MAATIKPEAIVDSSIEKKKLVSSVQTSLGKADTALQPAALNPYRTSADQDVIDATKVPEAPNDGKQYARKNKSWVEVVSTGGIPEAPTDGKLYARKNGQWVEVSVDLSAILARLDALETAMSTITINI